MHFIVEIKTNCVTGLIKIKSPTKVKRNVYRRYRRNEKAIIIKTIYRWLKDFQERGTFHEAKLQRKCTVDR